MFAGAAIMDARRKRDRLAQWDECIQQVKSHNEHSSTPTPYLPDIEDEARSVLQAKTYRIRGTPTHDELRGLRDRNHVSDFILGNPLQNYATSPLETQRILDTIQRHMKEVQHGVSLASASRALQHYESNINLEASSADPLDPARHEVLRKATPDDRNPKKAIHFHWHQRVIAKLVTRLMLETKPLAIPEYHNLHQAESLRFSDRRNIHSGRRSLAQFADTVLPRYAFAASSGLAECVERLNKTTDQLLRNQQLRPGNMNTVLAKICHNLLVSVGPPDIVTYNILLQHFTKMKLHRLAQIVVDSFLYDSNFRPDMTTTTLILRHYTAAGDKAGFSAFIQRMRGEVEDCRIKRVSLKRVAESSKLQRWAENHNVINRYGTLREKAPRDLHVFTAMVDGHLSFGNVEQAVMYTKVAFREGGLIYHDTFLHLVEALKDTRYNKHAFRLLEAIIECNRPEAPLLPQIFQYLYRPFNELLELVGFHINLTLRTFYSPPDLVINFPRFGRFSESLFGMKLWSEPYLYLKAPELLKSLRQDTTQIIGRLELSSSVQKSTPILRNIVQQLSKQEICYRSGDDVMDARQVNPHFRGMDKAS